MPVPIVQLPTGRPVPYGAHARPELPDPAQPDVRTLVQREGYRAVEPTRHAAREVQP
jgi:hypothetical protein